MGNADTICLPGPTHGLVSASVLAELLKYHLHAEGLREEMDCLENPLELREGEHVESISREAILKERRKFPA